MLKTIYICTKGLFGIVLFAGIFIMLGTPHVASQQIMSVPSRTSFPMPDIRGLTAQEAERRVMISGEGTIISSAKAVIDGQRLHWRLEGQVISQSPRAGQAISIYSDDVGGQYGQATFQITVSAGNSTPNFIGAPRSNAEDRAERLGLNLGFDPPVQSWNTPEGRIVTQDPEPNAPLRRDLRVKARLSSGFPLPDYEGEELELLMRDAREYRFRVETTRENHRSYPADTIISQDPPAGTLLPLRRPVGVIVSSGWPTTPDFVNRTRDIGRQMARSNRIRLTEQDEMDFETPRGIIISQSPAADSQLPENRQVSVTVSSGWPTTPNFIDRTREDARRIALSSDIRLVEADEEHFEKPQGIVISQSPITDVQLPPNRQVAVVVSGGWPVAPPAIGKSISDIRRQYSGIRIEQSKRDLSRAPVGEVLAQRPNAGTKLGPRKTLYLETSAGVPLWLWLLSGSVMVAGLGGAAIGINRLRTSRDHRPTADEMSNVTLRVDRDYGRQVIQSDDDTATPNDETLWIRVMTDVGTQSIDDEDS